MPFEKDNKLGLDRPNPGEGKDKSTKQREKEAFETNRTRIKEYMDDLWADWKAKDKEAGKQWKDAMKNLAPLVEDKAQIDIPDSQLVEIVKRVQKIYVKRTSKD